MEEITLIIPAKNEPNALPIVLNEIKKMQLSVKILVVIREEDEDTFKATNDYDCDVLYQSRKGYGNAIVEGINHVKTKYSCIFYADGSTDPKYINQMREKLVNEKLDLIFGSRYEKSAHSYDDDLITRIGNFGLLGNIFSLKFQIYFLLMFCKNRLSENMKLNSDDYCLCVEIPFKAKLSKLRYTTLPCIERKRFADKKKLKLLGMD